MSYQNISYVMPQADVDAVKAALATINQKMPFLITLSDDERKGVFKMGPKSVFFVQDCQMAVKSFPTIFPPTFNAVEFNKDADLVRSLSELQVLVGAIHEKINDTLMAVGGEAMASSLDVYSYVQTAADKTPGLKSLFEKLKERFKKSKSKKEE